MNIIIKDNYEQLSLEASKIVANIIKNKKDAVLGLATGSTPVGLYENLIKLYENNEISFKDVKSVNLDEYIGLPEGHPESYRVFMNEKLFNHIDIKPENTHLPNGLAEDLVEECKRYEEVIDSVGRQDIQILGIGENGHIGFNEPSSKLEKDTHIEDLSESTIHANSRFFDSIDDVPTTAISMGMGSIFKAKQILLLASGEKKAKIMKSLEDSVITPLIPASFLKLHPNVTVIMDKEAAKLYESN